jgi:hypothetical protein
VPSSATYRRRACICRARTSSPSEGMLPLLVRFLPGRQTRARLPGSFSSTSLVSVTGWAHGWRTPAGRWAPGPSGQSTPDSLNTLAGLVRGFSASSCGGLLGVHWWSYPQTPLIWTVTGNS